VAVGLEVAVAVAVGVAVAVAVAVCVVVAVAVAVAVAVGLAVGVAHVSVWVPSKSWVSDRSMVVEPVPLKIIVWLPGGFGMPSSRSIDRLLPHSLPTTWSVRRERTPPLGES